MVKSTTVEMNLDEKIRRALEAPPATSTPLLALLVETAAAIEVEDETSRTARSHAVDPRALDGVASRGRAEDAEFRAARYRAGLAELQKLLDAAVAAEQSVAWHEQADRVQAERDHLAAELRMRFPILVEELVSLFTAISACDRAIDRLHAAAPPTEGARRLRKVEDEARDITGAQGDSSIIDSTRLPKFAQHGVTMAWPPAKPSDLLGLLDIFPKNGMPSSDDDAFYEAFFDEAAGHFSMRRKSDAPALVLPTATPIRDMREQGTVDALEVEGHLG
jgi:hypothetical protein